MPKLDKAVVKAKTDSARLAELRKKKIADGKEAEARCEKSKVMMIGFAVIQSEEFIYTRPIVSDLCGEAIRLDDGEKVVAVIPCEPGLVAVFGLSEIPRRYERAK